MSGFITISKVEKFVKTKQFLTRLSKLDMKPIFDKYGRLGVEALRNATPKRTGKTSESWTYEVKSQSGHHEIVWKNSNTNKGVNIAIIIQYGHGTRQGGYVKGIDYINPALRPVMQKLADDLFEEVTKQ